MSENTNRKPLREMTIEELEAFLDSDEYERAMNAELSPKERKLAELAKERGPMTSEELAQMLMERQTTMTTSDHRWHQYIEEMEDHLDDETGQTPEPEKYWLKKSEES